MNTVTQKLKFRQSLLKFADKMVLPKRQSDTMSADSIFTVGEEDMTEHFNPWQISHIAPITTHLNILMLKLS